LEKAAFKYCVSGLVLCAAAASVSAFAAAQTADGWYLGTSVGRSNVKITDENASADDKRQGTGTGFKLYGGYQFNDYFALEGQYIRLATAKYHTIHSGGYQLDESYKISGLALDAVGILPISDSFSLLGKLGVMQMQIQSDWQFGSESPGSGKDSRTTPLIGIGAEYKLTPALALRAEYEYYGKLHSDDNTFKISTDMLSIGMRYTF
jgi:OOP family OmpA-OmpF porin